MALTQQEIALKEAVRKFGRTAYVEEHQNYKLVGFGRGRKKVFAVADTWREAIDALERKTGE